LADDSGPPAANTYQFRSIVGALQYLTFTRPDITYAVQQICLHMHDSQESHLTAMKRILRYLRGTLDFGLLLHYSSSSSSTPMPTGLAEYGALMSHGTWDLVPRPQGSNVVTSKWFFTHKFRADGTFDRYKARWVLRGFTQRPRVDYDETFNPVVKPTTMRTVLATAVSHNWLIQ
jgi:hypothetical protein